MRILVRDKETSVIEALEIQSACYDPDVFDLIRKEDEDPVTGLTFQDMEGDWFYIKDISKIECENICRKLVRDGYVDLEGCGYCGYEYLDLSTNQEDCEE